MSATSPARTVEGLLRVWEAALRDGEVAADSTQGMLVRLVDVMHAGLWSALGMTHLSDELSCRRVLQDALREADSVVAEMGEVTT